MPNSLQHANKRAQYVLLFISVTVIWGSGFLVTKDLVHAQVPVLLLLALRFAIGSAALALFRLFSPQKTAFAKTEWKHGFVLGLVMLVAFVLQTYGALYTTPAKNGMLTGLHVIFVPLLLLRKKNVRAKPFLDAAICLIGAMILSNVFGEKAALNWGDMLVILCAFVFAIQIILLEKYSPRLHTLHYTIAQLVTVALLALTASLLFERHLYARMQITPAILLRVLYLGVLSTAFAAIVQTLVQAKLPATSVSLLSCLESVFAVAFSLLFQYEAFSWHLMVGALIIVAAMLSALLLPNGRKNME